MSLKDHLEERDLRRGFGALSRHYSPCLKEIDFLGGVQGEEGERDLGRERPLGPYEGTKALERARGSESTSDVLGE